MRHIFLGHVITGLVFTIFGMWAGTQYAAHVFAYQKELGLPITTIGDVSIYFPWQWMIWDYYYNSYAPWVFDRAAWITWGSVFVMFAVMVVLAVFRAKKNKKSNAYGSARWATQKDLKRVGMIGNAGVFLAQTNDATYVSKTDSKGKQRWIMKRPGRHFIRHDGPEHVFCFAPTRSGKGVGLVIPTLVTWPDSVIVYDIKKENWALTAGYRREFSHCWRFEPTSAGSVRFNPLMEVRKGDREVQDVQNIADILVDPEGSGEKRDHWQVTGHALLVGAILHVLYAEQNKSLKGVSDFLSNPDRGIKDTLDVMMKTHHTKNGPHQVVAATAREMMNKSDNELSGVVSTASSYLSLYRDTIIAKNTAVSDFSISDLMNAEFPVSLYLVVPPSDIERTKPLIRLMLNQIGRRLTETMEFGEKKAYKHRLLMLLDEFPSLGQLGFFETELAYLAGYGIKCFMIAQSLNQIEKHYGQNNAILDNAHVRVTYGALDERTAKRISELLGQATEERKQTNFSGNRLAPWLGHMMESNQEFARPLLTPGEVLQLPFDDALVMVGGQPPYRAKKIMYYQDERFKDMVNQPAPDSPVQQAEELLPPRPSDWDSIQSLPAIKQDSSKESMTAGQLNHDRQVPQVPAPPPLPVENDTTPEAEPPSPSKPPPLPDAAEAAIHLHLMQKKEPENAESAANESSPSAETVDEPASQQASSEAGPGVGAQCDQEKELSSQGNKELTASEEQRGDRDGQEASQPDIETEALDAEAAAHEQEQTLSQSEKVGQDLDISI